MIVDCVYADDASDDRSASEPEAASIRLTVSVIYSYLVTTSMYCSLYMVISLIAPASYPAFTKPWHYIRFACRQKF